MRYFVQIVNEVEKPGNRHVRFPMKSKQAAEKFNAALIGLFKKHHVDSAMGSYPEGEQCPVCSSKAA
jgi:hypothetical protein